MGSDVRLWDLVEGDCLEKLRELPPDSIDAVVTDPPYGLSDLSSDQVADIMVRWGSGDDEFLPKGRGMHGQSWDVFVPPPAVWRECYRVLKPGGHLVAFSGTRTHDLMGLAVRLSGFEIRDRIYDFTGEAVPAPQGWLYGSGLPKGQNVSRAMGKFVGVNGDPVGGDVVDSWEGWNTALKPAVEPITVARKPLGESTVVGNVLKWSTGAVNIDGTRVPAADGEVLRTKSHTSKRGTTYGTMRDRKEDNQSRGQRMGRFTPNVVLDEGSVKELERQYPGAGRQFHTFRYAPKAPAGERPEIVGDDGTTVVHPTVKPVGVMEWLVDLVTPVGGIVLDPFAGSGTTLQAAVQCGFDVVGVERDPGYCDLIRERMSGVTVGRERTVAVEPDSGRTGDQNGSVADCGVDAAPESTESALCVPVAGFEDLDGSEVGYGVSGPENASQVVSGCEAAPVGLF